MTFTKTAIALFSLSVVPQFALANCIDLSGTYVFDGKPSSCSKYTLSSFDFLVLPTVSNYDGLLATNSPLHILQPSCGDVTFSYESNGNVRFDPIFTGDKSKVEWKNDRLEVSSTTGSFGVGNIKKSFHAFSKDSAGNLEMSYDLWNVSPFFGVQHEAFRCTLVSQ